MKILSYNPGHDGAIALIDNSRLVMSVEAEKDSNYRYSAISPTDILEVVSDLTSLPDVVCVGGWWHRDHHEFLHGSRRNSGYRGISPDSAIIRKREFFGGNTHYFSSSHERSHILSALGMSALPRGTPCYVLVWEGELGSFYEIDADFRISLVGDVLGQPGNRYGLVYGLADPTFPKDGPYPRPSDAGKLMALASFSRRSTPTAPEAKLLEFLLAKRYRKLSDYERLAQAPHLNVGLDDQAFRDFAGIFSDAIFDTFWEFARTHLTPGRPLLISGGCGLNCDWNSRWRNKGLFSQVFVPPVANDSGAAIGTAIDAQLHLTGNPKIEWSVYAGQPFRDDVVLPTSRYAVFQRDEVLVAELLDHDLILGWVQGKYEIGPRALGNRSILAAPFATETRDRLNEIKQREPFRPIAPVCLREDAAKLFGCNGDSPYMLYTYQVAEPSLRAVTHSNGTARIQTVTASSQPALHALLAAFKARTGHGVLCNTSLNFKGKGFVNRLSDLDALATTRGLDGFVVNDRVYVLRDSERYKMCHHSLEINARGKV